MYKSRYLSNTLIILGIALLYQSAQAIPHSSIRLKNGSVINGDITVQRLGDDITIEAKNAIFIIEPKDIEWKNTRRVRYDELSREIKRWVLENRVLKGDAYGRFAELDDIKTKHKTYYGLVNNIEDGIGTNTYIQLLPTTYNFKWKDIDRIDRIKSDDIRYRIIDRVTTYEGKKHEGTIISQNAGKSITIETNKGTVVIPNDEIKEIDKTVPNNSTDLFNLIDFENEVVLRDGTQINGLIISHHYGKKAKDNYLTLIDKNGKIDNILLSTVSEFRTKYDKTETSIYNPGKVYLNEFRIDKAHIQRVDNNIVFIEKKVFPFPEGIGITFKSDGNDFSDGWSLIALTEQSTSTGKSSWGFRIDQKEDQTIHPNSKGEAETISQINYSYLSPGFYTLINEPNTEAYVFKITK